MLTFPFYRSFNRPYLIAHPNIRSQPIPSDDVLSDYLRFNIPGFSHVSRSAFLKVHFDTKNYIFDFLEKFSYNSETIAQVEIEGVLLEFSYVFFDDLTAGSNGVCHSFTRGHCQRGSACRLLVQLNVQKTTLTHVNHFKPVNIFYLVILFSKIYVCVNYLTQDLFT